MNSETVFFPSRFFCQQPGKAVVNFQFNWHEKFKIRKVLTTAYVCRYFYCVKGYLHETQKVCCTAQNYIAQHKENGLIFYKLCSTTQIERLLSYKLCRTTQIERLLFYQLSRTTQIERLLFLKFWRTTQNLCLV
jgi:hypothetical protein